MKTLLKQYYDAKLAKYLATMDIRSATIAANYALDDMRVTVKRNLDIHGELDTQLLLLQEIEDVRACI